jgi:hypothetical protein
MKIIKRQRDSKDPLVGTFVKLTNGSVGIELT